MGEGPFKEKQSVKLKTHTENSLKLEKNTCYFLVLRISVNFQNNHNHELIYAQ